MQRKLVLFLSFVVVISLLTVTAGSVSAYNTAPTRQHIASEVFSLLIPNADTTPPTVTHTLTGTLGLNLWYTTAVVVTLTATDEVGGSGVDYIEWWLEGQVTPHTIVHAATTQTTLAV